MKSSIYIYIRTVFIYKEQIIMYGLHKKSAEYANKCCKYGDEMSAVRIVANCESEVTCVLNWEPENVLRGAIHKYVCKELVIQFIVSKT